MLSNVIQSVPALREQSRLLSADDVENSLRRVMTYIRGEAGCEYIQVANLNVANADKEQVTRWFESLAIPCCTINVYWVAQREGVEMPLDRFVAHFDDLWFPSSHDVFVEDHEHRFLFILDHEEHFSFWSRCKS
jgi:hypothetical protein